MERIGFGKRLLAALIDGLFFFLLLMIIVMAGITGVTIGGGFIEMLTGMMSLMTTGSLLLPVIGILYNFIEGFTGASPGKMLLGIKIGNADGSQGNQALFLKRTAYKTLPSIIGLLAYYSAITAINTASSIASFIFIFGCLLAFGKNKQALHDIIFKSAVYRKSSLHG